MSPLREVDGPLRGGAEAPRQPGGLREAVHVQRGLAVRVGAGVVLRRLVVLGAVLHGRADVAELGLGARLPRLLALKSTCDHVTHQLLGLKAPFDWTLLATLAGCTVVQQEPRLFTDESVAFPIAAL